LAKKRRSPIKHDVRAHQRQGRPVHHYERGEGKAPRAVIGSTSVGRGGTYRVNVNYLDSEAFEPKGGSYPAGHGAKTLHLTVRASSYLQALDEGIAKVGSGTPISVMMRRI
jgi:hypothetical protein